MRPLRPSVLFVCEGNSCRSVMAEAFATQKLPGWTARSAGLNPLPEYDSRAALATLGRDFGIALGEHRQTDVRNLELDGFTHVIAMDEHIAAALRRLTAREVIAWDIDDPWEGDPEEYRQCALRIRGKLADFAELTAKET